MGFDQGQPDHCRCARLRTKPFIAAIAADPDNTAGRQDERHLVPSVPGDLLIHKKILQFLPASPHPDGTEPITGAAPPDDQRVLHLIGVHGKARTVLGQTFLCLVPRENFGAQATALIKSDRPGNRKPHTISPMRTRAPDPPTIRLHDEMISAANCTQTVRQIQAPVTGSDNQVKHRCHMAKREAGRGSPYGLPCAAHEPPL
jgi:hypothetical protein